MQKTLSGELLRLSPLGAQKTTGRSRWDEERAVENDPPKRRPQLLRLVQWRE